MTPDKPEYWRVFLFNNKFASCLFLEAPHYATEVSAAIAAQFEKLTAERDKAEKLMLLEKEANKLYPGIIEKLERENKGLKQALTHYQAEKDRFAESYQTLKIKADIIEKGNEKMADSYRKAEQDNQRLRRRCEELEGMVSK